MLIILLMPSDTDVEFVVVAVGEVYFVLTADTYSGNRNCQLFGAMLIKPTARMLATLSTITVE